MSQTISGGSNERGQIYIFLQASTSDVQQWAALSDDGHCLAWTMFSTQSPEASFLRAKRNLGNDSANKLSYKGKYPQGYDLNFIKDINSPENILLLNRIREVTSAIVKAAQASGKYKPPGAARGN